MSVNVDSIFEKALPLLKERLDDYGYHHSLGAASTARDLALIYQVDPDEAYLAGLLHDWDRCILNEDIIARARAAGMELCPEALEAPKILHAHTGAQAVHETFPELPASVIAAIRHHTVGVPHMSNLDKVVYLADMVEPGREGPVVATLREMVGTIDLEALFIQAYQKSMLHLIHNHKVMHPDTCKVWNSLMFPNVIPAPEPKSLD